LVELAPEKHATVKEIHIRSAVYIYALIVHRRVEHAFALFVISIVLCTSLFHKMVEYGEN